MLKLKINYSTYYVGNCREISRLYRKAIKHGYIPPLKTLEPKIGATYCLHFLSYTKKVFMENFSNIASFGHYNCDKEMPDYRRYKGDIKLARAMYEMHK